MFTGTLSFDDTNQEVSLTINGQDHLLRRPGGPGTDEQHAFATMSVVRDILAPPTTIVGTNVGGNPFVIELP